MCKVLYVCTDGGVCMNSYCLDRHVCCLHEQSCWDYIHAVGINSWMHVHAVWMNRGYRGGRGCTSVLHCNLNKSNINYSIYNISYLLLC
jgi:hypothetical protein